jgi:hypothetical protein
VSLGRAAPPTGSPRWHLMCPWARGSVVGCLVGLRRLWLAKTTSRSPSAPSVADAARPALPPTLAAPLPSPSGLEHLHVMADIFLSRLGALRWAFHRRGDLILENLAL